MHSNNSFSHQKMIWVCEVIYSNQKIQAWHETISFQNTVFNFKVINTLFQFTQKNHSFIHSGWPTNDILSINLFHDTWKTKLTKSTFQAKQLDKTKIRYVHISKLSRLSSVSMINYSKLQNSPQYFHLYLLKIIKISSKKDGLYLLNISLLIK